MTFKVAIACEDHTLDQYIVKPVISGMLATLGKPQAVIGVITDPRVMGISNLRAKACALLAKYGPVSDVVLFVIDADGDDGQSGNRDRKADWVDFLSRCENHAEKALVVTAIQEVEVWAIWGSRSNLRDSWQIVRAEPHPKEHYFDSLTTRTDLKAPGRGRSRLVGVSLANGWKPLSNACPELRELATEIRALF